MPYDVSICSHRAIPYLLTYLRDKETSNLQFSHYASRLMTLLAEEALSLLDAERVEIATPTGSLVNSSFRINMMNVCAVSILRAGDSLLECMRHIEPGLSVGKILIQRDESSLDKKPVLFYHKLPPQISKMQVILCDPMLATGGTVIKAIDVLLEAGCSADLIIFANVIACPEGIQALKNSYPSVRIVTCVVDEGLNEQKYIVPGLGDFGDRFYNTT